MQPLKILYIGDIMGRPGREVVAHLLSSIKAEYGIDVVVAQAENVSHGKSITTHHLRELQTIGIDFFTAGNHTMERPSLVPLLANPNEPVIAPLNQVGIEPSWAIKTIKTTQGEILVTSLLGTTFPEREGMMTNPLMAIDKLIEAVKRQNYIAHVVNLHSDFSSEKRVLGYYLDGRVTAVIGDHWHVPTADAMVLPQGTAHITDVGMCGTLHSSLGVSKEVIISRWRDDARVRNEIAEGAPYQFNAVVITVNCATGFAQHIQPIQKIVTSLDA